MYREPMTRVMVLSDLYRDFPGGAERLAGNVARDLMQRGMDVHVLTGYGPAVQGDGPPVTISEGITNDTAGWAEIATFIDQFRPDVILTHHLYARWFADQLAATGVPLVQLVLNGSRMPAAVFAVYITEHVRSLDPTHRVTDMVMWPPAFPDVAAGSHGDAIGFIKPIEHKGVRLVYEIAALMPERRFLVLRGEWVTLEILSDLPNVEYMDAVTDIREFYERVDLVLVPSVSEDAGTVAQECTLNEIPCISSDVDGLRETNGGGIRMVSRDPSDWVDAIRVMDGPEARDRCVKSMGDHYAGHDHPRRLAEFAARVEALG